MILFFFILSSTSTSAELEPSTVSEMIERSDLIFHGKITKIIDDNIEVTIIKTVKGKFFKKKIKILMICSELAW